MYTQRISSSEDSDQTARMPRHSRSLIRILLNAFWTAKDTKFLHEDNGDSDQTAADAQVDLSLRWAHMSGGTFSHVTVDITAFVK